jgi:hypothetical protein
MAFDPGASSEALLFVVDRSRLDDDFRRAALAADIIRNRRSRCGIPEYEKLSDSHFKRTFAASPLWSMRARMVRFSDLRIVSNPATVSDTEWELPR